MGTCYKMLQHFFSFNCRFPRCWCVLRIFLASPLQAAASLLAILGTVLTDPVPKPQEQPQPQPQPQEPQEQPVVQPVVQPAKRAQPESEVQKVTCSGPS